MHEAAGNQRFISQSILHIKEQLLRPAPEVNVAISHGIASNEAIVVEATRLRLLEHVSDIAQKAQLEPSHADQHYVSRFDGVGLFQSALSKIFADIPNLQGYGDWNPIWVITLIEEFAHKVKTLLADVHEDATGKKQPAWAAIISEMLRLRTFDDRAAYPAGVPDSVQLPERLTMVLIADWGGDNDVAKKIASEIRRQKPDFIIHLGDIYYGGTQHECELFLDMWPMRLDMENAKSPLQPKGSFALNGNHEMYSGGEYFFNTVLPAFGQKQPFFCLENANWRIIGLDTAYNGGRLKPLSTTDPMNAQWNWLIDTLRKEKKATIFLTHHQPLSAHQAEWNDSKPLRADIEDLLHVEGIGEDAIFGWFFGHEHRCAVYTDTALKFNARLIGNGCIPHEVQKEKAADPGCDAVDFFNKKETAPGSNAAVSSFVKLSFGGTEVLIEYVDETFDTFGAEVWNSTKGRLPTTKRRARQFMT